MPIFSIQKLNYNDLFHDFNFQIEKGEFISILGTNRSGKTTLTKIISAIIPTTDNCILDGISLNKQTVLTYITKLGIVTNDFNQQYLFKKVKDELAYPLLNLGYTEHKINKRIKEISKFFKIENLLNKNLDSLTLTEKKKLSIIISLVHEPDLLVLDDAFIELSEKDKTFILQKLSNLTKKGLTVLNLTSNIDTTYQSDKIFILKNFQIQKQTTLDDLLEDTDYLKKQGFTIPFIIDISIKLKYFKLIDKIYFNLEDLEGALWK